MVTTISESTNIDEYLVVLVMELPMVLSVGGNVIPISAGVPVQWGSTSCPVSG